ncbi:MAG: FtsX-like permease family protein [Polyangia bacterium]
MSIFRMAWRNVWRNRRRTAITVAAASLALATMIAYSGLISGYLLDMEKNIVDLEIGDLQIAADDYLERPSLYTRIEDHRALLAVLSEAGYPAAARLEASGLAAGDKTSAGVRINGVEVERDRGVSSIFEHVARGRWLRPGEKDGAVVGRVVARVLEVDPGDEILVLSQAADGSTANALYTVRGVLGAVGDAVDRSGLFLTAGAFRELMIVPNGAHRVVVRRGQDQSLAAAAREVSELVGGLTVESWRELLPTLASMLDSAGSAVYVMFMLVYVAIGIVILNAMLMAVFERIRELGVLKALGFGPLGVLRLILAETAIQLALALVVGGALSLPALCYLASSGIELGEMGGIAFQGATMASTMRARIEPAIFVGPVVMLVAVVLAAVLYPALKAALISPVRAIRHS